MPSELLPTVSPSLVEEKREDFSEKINLDLGIGRVAVNEGVLKEENKKKIKQERKECIFTARQLHEFYHQIFVYNFIASGLPLPLHLFLPIWMSVCKSYGPSICNKYPSFAGLSPANGMMDPESGRCRRTDGRKWRCSKNVVLDQKYCEQHMHRGRLSSRKHVENPESKSRANHETSTLDDTKGPAKPSATSDAKNNISFSSQTDPDPNLPCNGVPAVVRRRNGRTPDALSAVQTTVDACRGGGHKFDGNIHVDLKGDGAKNSDNSIKVNYAGLQNACLKNISGRKHEKGSIGFVSAAVGVGGSPKTELHCRAGEVSLGLEGQNIIKSEPQRCRRTDGKKWQCSRDALPHQKYCEAHMHRGVKRPISNAESGDKALAASTRKARISLESHDNHINLNMTPGSPQDVASNYSMSSSSDATTITDENIGACLVQSILKG